jgi:hypothetical protein
MSRFMASSAEHPGEIRVHHGLFSLPCRFPYLLEFFAFSPSKLPIALMHLWTPFQTRGGGGSGGPAPAIRVGEQVRLRLRQQTRGNALGECAMAVSYLHF